MRPSTRFARRSAFVRYAAVAYVAVVVYASLYPLTGWRVPSHELLWVRLAEWPRFYTYSDVFLNVLAYAPLGLLLTLMLRTRFTGVHAATLAMAFATGLSFAMEVLQAWVPARVPSALDVFCNAVGGLVGAWLGLAVAEPLLRGGRLARWRERRLVAGASADVGLTLLALWFFTHLNAALWLFGTGDARQFFPTLAATYTPDAYIALEAGVTGFALVAVAGLAGIIARDGVMVLIVPIVLIALVLKSAASLFLFNPGQPFLWVTPGAGIGLFGVPCSLTLCCAGVSAPRRRRPGRARGERGIAQHCAGQPISRGDAPGLAAWAFLELHRHDRHRVDAMAARGRHLSADLDVQATTGAMILGSSSPVAPDSLQGLRAALREFAAARDWERFHLPKNIAMALIVEAAELVEHFQWLTPEQSGNLDAAQRAEVADEIADVLLYLVRMADVLDVDPVAAARAKMIKNAVKYPAPER